MARASIKRGKKKGARTPSRPDGGKVYRDFANFRKGDRVRLQFVPSDDSSGTLRRGVTGIVEDITPGEAVDVRWNVGRDRDSRDREYWSIFGKDLSNGILSRRPRTELLG